MKKQPVQTDTSSVSNQVPSELVKLTPLRSFVQSRSIIKLWTARMLVKLGASDEVFGSSTLHRYVGRRNSMVFLEVSAFNG